VRRRAAWGGISVPDAGIFADVFLLLVDAAIDAGFEIGFAHLPQCCLEEVVGGGGDEDAEVGNLGELEEGFGRGDGGVFDDLPDVIVQLVARAVAVSADADGDDIVERGFVEGGTHEGEVGVRDTALVG
jgi:hypothetical protein